MINTGHFKLVIIRSGYVDVDGDPKPLHKGLPCDAVILSLWNTVDDASDTLKTRDSVTGYDEQGEEVYWGSGQACGHQVFPQETTSYIGVKDAHDVTVRCHKGSTGIRVFWSAFRYEPITIKEGDRH